MTSTRTQADEALVPGLVSPALAHAVAMEVAPTLARNAHPDWDGVDWVSIAEEAVRHGVMPALHHFLAKHGTAPDGVMERANDHWLRARAMQLKSHAELADVIAGLGDAEITPIVLKGPSIASVAYPHPAWRTYQDLDLLIREDEWPRFRATLLEMGYAALGRTDGRLPPRISPVVGFDHWATFVHKGRVPIESKFDALELGLRSRVIGRAHERSVLFDTGKACASMLPVEEQLIVSCVHLNRHGFQQLRWFADVAGLLERQRDALDWERAEWLAREEGLGTVVSMTLAHVEHALDLRLPYRVGDAFRSSVIARRVWEREWPAKDRERFAGRRDGVMVFEHAPGMKALAKNIALTGRAADKVGYLARRLLPSAEYLRWKDGDAASAPYHTMLARRYAAWLQRGTSGARASEGRVLASIRPGNPNVCRFAKRVVSTKIAASVTASVIVVTYDHPRAAVLLDCLHALEQQSERGFELVLMLNGPAPTIASFDFDSLNYPVTVVQLKQNFGHAAALNVGAQFARGELLMFLDDDAIPESQWVGAFRDAVSDMDAVAARGGLRPRHADNALNDVEYLVDGPQVGPYILDREGNMAILRSVFVQVGGLDPELRGFFGAELTYRLIQAGIPRERIVAWPDAMALHDHAESVRDFVVKHYRWSLAFARLSRTYPALPDFLFSYGAIPEDATASSGRVLGGPRYMLIAALAALAGRVGWRFGWVLPQRTVLK